MNNRQSKTIIYCLDERHTAICYRCCWW